MASSRFREALRLGSVTPDLDASLHFGGKGGTPPAPDYRGAAEAQGAANVETARTQNIMGNPNIFSPYGSQTVTWGDSPSLGGYAGGNADSGFRYWRQDDGGNWFASPDNPTGQTGQTPIGYDPNATRQPIVDINLSPEQQRLFDLENRIKGQFGSLAEGGMSRVADAFSKPFSFASGDALQSKAEDALLSRLMPQLNRQRESREGALIQQGHGRGGEAWNALQEGMGQQENDAMKMAIIDALKIRPQLLQEELAIRNIPLNEANALRTGAQVQVPQFQPFAGAGVSPPPLMQAAQNEGQAAMNTYNAEVGQQNAQTTGLFALGSAALMAF